MGIGNLNSRRSRGRFACLIFLLGFSAQVFPATLEELTGDERTQALLAGETLTEVQTKNPQTRLLPRHAGLRQLVEEAMLKLVPNILAESLLLYKKAPNARRAIWNEDERRALYNNSIALSSLTGIEYYSASRKQMRTFYEYSRVIDNPESKKALDDPSFDEPPASLCIYARQKDLSFGDNIYRYDFFTDLDYLIFTQENLTSMRYGVIPALGKNKLRSVVAVIDTGNALLIYAASMADAPSIPGFTERISNSFTNRAAAVLKWFSGQADKVFGN
ncbi:MAG: hypothetical protein LBE10_07410 [Treponema sp.]|nr:hypothetical protein [Treponema sp.]